MNIKHRNGKIINEEGEIMVRINKNRNEQKKTRINNRG